MTPTNYSPTTGRLGRGEAHVGGETERIAHLFLRPHGQGANACARAGGDGGGGLGGLLEGPWRRAEWWGATSEIGRAREI